MRTVLLTLVISVAAAAEPVVPEPTLASILADLPEAVAAELRAQQTAFRAEHGRDPASADYAPWVDAACHQLGAVSSRLYWHTDLDAALAEARKRGVPVLSLRLLGRLDEELSCANSRFFRRVLYANQSVAEVLREGFVLHWSSERPVPRVTVDYGDGRRIETTITGNSIHYLLDHDGRVADALPGLVTPRIFTAFCIQGAQGLLRDGQTPRSPHYSFRPSSAFTSWLEVVRPPVFGENPLVAEASFRLAATDHQAPRADRAQGLTVSKSLVEMPIQDAVAARPSRRTLAAMPATPVWGEPPIVLDATTRHLVASDLSRMAERANRSIDVEAELAAFAARVKAESDSNLGALRPHLQDWLAALDEAPTLMAFNQRVYAELLYTPASDPWLGLVDFGYTGLPDGGISAIE